MFWSVSWWVRYQSISLQNCIYIFFWLQDRYFSDMIQLVVTQVCLDEWWDWQNHVESTWFWQKLHFVCVAILTNSLMFVALQNQGGSPWFFGFTVHPNMHVWFHRLRPNNHIYVGETWFEHNLLLVWFGVYNDRWASRSILLWTYEAVNCSL